MPKIASFPFTFIDTTKMGKIFRPYAIVFIYAKLRKKWQPVEMIIDSGADYSLFPKKYAALFGINLTRECTVETTLGIGGAETVYQYQNLPIKIGSWQNQIPVGFLERDDIPALLGRLECLEIFRLVFQNKESFFEIP